MSTITLSYPGTPGATSSVQSTHSTVAAAGDEAARVLGRRRDLREQDFVAARADGRPVIPARPYEPEVYSVRPLL